MQYHSFDLEERLMRFAVQVLNMIETLTNSIGAHVWAYGDIRHEYKYEKKEHG